MLFVLSSVVCWSAAAQINPIPMGQITLRELRQEVYPDDTSAHAVMLKENGEAWVDNERELRLVFHYYGKIKIQDAQGLEAANIIIPLYRGKRGDEEVFRIKAFAYNFEDSKIVKTELSQKDIYEEDVSENVTLKKFTFPNARPGSVLEYSYELESPYLFNFRDWVFQSRMPTVRSEYWARIPGNFIYNMRLVGPFELSLNESSISKDCFRGGNGGVADCVTYKWAMDSIPAFIPEDYMTAASDFMPAVRFELSEVRLFDGQVNKVTKTWEDLDQELKQDKTFGLAIKKAAGDLEGITGLLSAASDASAAAGVSGTSGNPGTSGGSGATGASGTPDASGELLKARNIYYHFQGHFKWNGEFTPFADDLVKSYGGGTGSVAAINLCLVAALQSAGLEAHPVLLSTRENGYPVDIHPVISDFNYVVAYTRIDGKAYMLDATEKFLPFGMLPFRCLTKKVRVMDFEHSFWAEIPAAARFREITQLKLAFDEKAHLNGSYKSYKYGYDALSHRQEIAGFNGEDEYISSLEDELDEVEILNYKNKNLDTLENPLVEEYDLEINNFSGGRGGNIYLSAFLLNKIDENPFKLKERYYPVDFGAGWEVQNLVNIQLPENYKVSSLPKPVGLALPESGGSFIMNVTGTSGQVNILSKIVLNKAVYTPEEYYYVKEMFNRIVQAHASTIVLEPVE